MLNIENNTIIGSKDLKHENKNLSNKLLSKKGRTSNKDDFNKIEGEQLLFDNRINSLPVIMTFQQVADLFQVSLWTIYKWSSLGRLDKCKFKIGKTVRVHRDKLFKEFFSESFLRKGSK